MAPDLASPSTRRAWIEIKVQLILVINSAVALHTEGVDRNRYIAENFHLAVVALHTEGVDRNIMHCFW